MAILFITCALLVLLTAFYFKFRYPYVKKMNRVPGPNGQLLLGILYETLHTPPNKRIEIIQNYFRRYGSIFRTWVGGKCIIHIANAEYAQVILSSYAHVNKSKIYSLFEPWLGSGMFISDGEKWAQRRKIFTPSFHLSLIKDFVDMMVNNGQILIERLEMKASGESFDIYPYFKECALNIIAETALGVNLNVQKESALGLLENIHRLGELIADRIQNPLLEWNFLHKFTRNYREQKKLISELRNFSTKIIKQRIENRKKEKLSKIQREGEEAPVKIKKKPFLDTLIVASEEGDKNVTLTDIREELDGFIFAAFDSVSTSLAWTCFLVGCHPEVQAQIHAELDEVVGSNERRLDMQTIHELPYLECVYKESLRLNTPVPIVARNLGENVQLGDHEILAGTNVLIHLHLIHCSPEYYSNPNQFDPSRTFGDPNAYIPFISGPRNCMGRKFAMTEALIILAMFFQRYKVESLTKESDMKVTWNLIWRPEDGIRVKIKRRCESSVKSGVC